MALSSIRKGDTIGVIAPSSPCEPKALKRGLEYLRELGFNTKVALDPSKAYGADTYLFSSDTPENRAEGLEDLFLDKSVQAIISARGAYGTLEMLPFINFDLIARNPKPLVGFSDTTALLLAVLKKCDMPVIHGPTVSGTFAKAKINTNCKRSADALIKLLTGELSEPFSNLSFKNIGVEKSAEGFSLGGSLTMFCSLLGTPFEPKTDGAILFLEEVGERPYRIARMLMQLELAGKLKGVQGVVLGDFKDCDHGKGPKVDEVILNAFQKYKLPIYCGVPFGHADLNLPFYLGAATRLDSGSITFQPN